MELCYECIKKSKTNAKNHHGGRETAVGTHTGGSISIGEYRKRLAIEKALDPTPSELHLYIHTHDYDGKSFVDEHSLIVHHITKLRGEKRREEYMGLDLKQKLLRVGSSCLIISTTFSFSINTGKMIPALTNYFLPVILEWVQEVGTPIDNPLVVIPIVPPSATTNIDEVDPLVSSDDRIIP